MGTLSPASEDSQNCLNVRRHLPGRVGIRYSARGMLAHVCGQRLHDRHLISWRVNSYALAGLRVSVVLLMSLCRTAAKTGQVLWHLTGSGSEPVPVFSANREVWPQPSEGISGGRMNGHCKPTWRKQNWRRSTVRSLQQTIVSTQPKVSSRSSRHK